MADTRLNGTVPRPASSVLVLRDAPLSVLLVRRHRSATFPSALVFPGGVVEEGDSDDRWGDVIRSGASLERGERAHRIAGIRETYEETGLVLTSSVPIVAGRIRSETPLLDALLEVGATLDLDALVPFGHWITAPSMPKRFDTRFYLCAAPLQQPVVDGTELVSHAWRRPATVLAEAASGRESMLFPTVSNLMRLDQGASIAEVVRAAEDRPPFTVEPRLEVDDDGATYAVIPHEAWYPVSRYPVSRRDTP